MTAPPGLVVEVRQEVPLLPKVAFVLISLASLLGALFTGMHLGLAPWALALRWLLLWLSALALGFAAWRALYLREERDLEGAEAFLEEEREVWRGRARGLGVVLVLSAPLALFLPYLGPLARLLSLTTLALGGALALGWPRVALGLAGGVFALWAWADTFGLLAFALRFLHFLAFGLWLGGALFNLTVNVPVGMRYPQVPAVVAGARQLERFRFVVRLALPTVLLTGLLMASAYRLPLEAFRLFPFSLIGLKLLLLVALVVIFLTCPLYRQCSPVKGVCRLEDLKVKPLHRLDNRGTPCALGLIRATEVMEALPSGAVLELLSKDVYAPYEVPAWAGKYGYRILKQERRGIFPFRYYRFLVGKP
jgi:putative copper resistance protein D